MTKRKDKIEQPAAAPTPPPPWGTPAEGVDNDTVTMLQNLLAQAQAGEVHGLLFAAVQVSQTGGFLHVTTGFSGACVDRNRHAAIGAASSLEAYLNETLIRVVPS